MSHGRNEAVSVAMATRAVASPLRFYDNDSRRITGSLLGLDDDFYSRGTLNELNEFTCHLLDIIDGFAP